MRDPAEVAPLLRSDRRWCAYALADLEEPFWSASRFLLHGRSVLLDLRLPSFRALFPAGDPAEVGILIEGLEPAPSRAELVVQEPLLGLFGRRFTWGRVEPMLRQYVAPEHFHSGPISRIDGISRIERVRDVELLEGLYQGQAGGFDPVQVAAGVFFGAFDRDSRLVAAAGTHTVSRTFGVGVLGNVYTQEDWRGKGLAGTLSGAVVATLFADGCDEVVLNVRADNVPALRAYAALGFRTFCPFLETTLTLSSQY